MGSAISTVGSLVVSTSSGSYISSVSVSPATKGDIFVVWAMIYPGSNADSYTSISGGGVTTWTKVASTVEAVGGLSGLFLTMFWGVITTTGSTTITLTGTDLHPTGDVCSVCAQEFTTGGGTGTTWAEDGTQSGTLNNSSSTTFAFPTLTPSTSNDLYIGGSVQISIPTSGSQTSGYTMNWEVHSGSGDEGVCCLWNTGVPQSAQSPTVAGSPAGVSASVAILLTGTNPVTYVPGPPANRARLIRASHW